MTALDAPEPEFGVVDGGEDGADCDSREGSAGVDVVFPDANHLLDFPNLDDTQSEVDNGVLLEGEPTKFTAETVLDDEAERNVGVGGRQI